MSQNSAPKLDVLKTAPLKLSGSMFVIDNLNQKISITKLSTKIELLIAFNITFDKEIKKWKPLYHVGVLCSNNGFVIAGETYSFCLLHALPVKDGENNIRVSVNFANKKGDLEQALKDFLPTESCQFKEMPLGETGIPLHLLAVLSKSICNLQFSLNGYRERIVDSKRLLVPAGMTNSLHTALMIAEAMGFGNCEFNDYLIQLLGFCYQRVIDMNSKYTDDCDFKKLAFDMVSTYGFRHEVSSETTEKIDRLITRLQDENLILKYDSEVKKAYIRAKNQKKKRRTAVVLFSDLSSKLCY